MDCKQDLQPDGTYKCDACGTIFEKPIRANCRAVISRNGSSAPELLPCVHRGPLTGSQVTAAACCGHTFEIATSSCKLHGECVPYSYNPASEGPIVANCGRCAERAMVAKPICTVEKLTNFGAAIGRHLLNGGQMCSQEQVDKRWSKCGVCPLRVDFECTQCGCNVRPEVAAINKLAWPKETCPLFPPLWEPIMS